MRVTPVRGRAVLFCNVLPTGAADLRTVHIAHPVPGPLRKYGVNVWICDENLQELATLPPKIKPRQVEQVVLPAATADMTNTAVEVHKERRKRVFACLAGEKESALGAAERLTAQFVAQDEQRQQHQRRQEQEQEQEQERPLIEVGHDHDDDNDPYELYWPVDLEDDQDLEDLEDQEDEGEEEGGGQDQCPGPR